MKNCKKKILCGFLAGAVLFASGCGNKDTQDQAKVQRYAWPLGSSSPEDTVTQIYAEKFAEEVERLSGGMMLISVYPNSVLGGDRELLESCKEGDIPFVVQNTAPQVTFMPDVAVFDMPAVFETIDEVREHVDNPDFLSMMQQVYGDAGYVLLGYADQGFRVMTTNRNVQSISDFKGQKIRTMENSYHMAYWKALGASPTPMTFSEVYIGLQQGTIDAQENPYEVIVSNKLYEQQDYVVETNHLPHLISLIVSDEFFEGLTGEQQEIIREAAETAKEYAREQSDAGYVLLGYADQGFRVMTTNRNVQSISDFKGQKIRTMENSYHMAYWKALGASPTPMTFSEVYIGLQQGTIDAQENPYEVIVSNKLYEQQDYVVETNHLPHLISLIVSDEFFEGLTGEQQEIIREAAETAKEYAREQSDERIASRIQTIEESGTQIISLNDEMHEQIRELCKPVYESIEKNVSEDLVDAYLGDMKGVIE